MFHDMAPRKEPMSASKSPEKPDSGQNTDAGLYLGFPHGRNTDLRNSTSGVPTSPRSGSSR